MNIFPEDVWKIIVKYQRDMELFELSPTPKQLENTVMGCDFLYPMATDWDCETFLLNRFTELMLGDFFNCDLEDYVKMFVHIPLHRLEEYIQAKEILQKRNRIWGVESDDIPTHWYYTTACIIHDYVLTRNTTQFITRLVHLCDASTTNTLLLT